MTSRDRTKNGRPIQTYFRDRDERKQIDRGAEIASSASGRRVAMAQIIRAATIALTRRPAAIALAWGRAGALKGAEPEDALVDALDSWLDEQGADEIPEDQLDAIHDAEREIQMASVEELERIAAGAAEKLAEARGKLGDGCEQ